VDNYVVEATVTAIGEITQVPYTDKVTGQPKVFTKFEVECQVGDELHTFESAGFNRDKLEVGSKYMLEIQPKGEYTDSIRKVNPIGQGGVASAPKPKPVQAPPESAPVPKKAPAPKDSPSPKPDFASRWREYNTHARTAQMQATERVKLYVQLVLDGKLLADGGNVTSVRKSTIEQWISEEMNRYWDELEVRVPSDIFGDLKESE
jgi:hypothetical protein